MKSYWQLCILEAMMLNTSVIWYTIRYFEYFYFWSFYVLFYKQILLLIGSLFNKTDFNLFIYFWFFHCAASTIYSLKAYHVVPFVWNRYFLWKWESSMWHQYCKNHVILLILVKIFVIVLYKKDHLSYEKLANAVSGK